MQFSSALCAWLVLGVVTLNPGLASAQDTDGAMRPRIGLALGGGAARGIAHVGILQWFEEHRIPVDVIAGTSAGGLIGGAYASGLAPSEILELLQAADWDLVFLADSPFRHKTFRRKEDARAFPGQLDFGLKGGLKLPTGLNAGQQVELLLDRIALSYPDLPSFDSLPTRFRCVATDLRSGRLIVLESGSLARSMRATMAIPGVFTPVELDGHLLIDGGTLNNVPADIARQAGADVVIAVNVSSSTDDGAKQVTNLFSVLGQAIDVMMSRGVQAALKDANLLITPRLEGLSGMDWRRADELTQRGYEAAEAMRESLLPYAVDEAAWQAWARDRQSRRRVGLPALHFVRVAGIGQRQQALVEERLTRLLVGRPATHAEIEDAVLQLSGTDRYELIQYRIAEEEGKAGLLLNVTPKSIGPPFLLPALDLSNVDSHAFALSARARLAVYDALIPGTELRMDVGVGTRETVAGEVYRQAGWTGLFGAARGYFDRKPVTEYDDDGELVAEYLEKRTGAGGDVGWTDGRRHEVRVGFDVADVRARVRIGEPSLQEAVGADRFASLRWTFDSQTSPNIPTRGTYSRATLKYYFAVPDLVSPSGERQQTGEVLQAEVRLNNFRRWHGRHRLFVSGGAGTSFDDEPGYHRFALGGPFQLGAYTRGRVTGNHYVLANVGLLRQLTRLPDVLGGDVFLGGWLENGTAFDEWKAARYHGSASASLVVETLLGVAWLGGSVSVTDGSYRIYVALGPLDDTIGIFR